MEVRCIVQTSLIILTGIVLSSVVRCEEYGNYHLCNWSQPLVCDNKYNWSQPLVCDNNTQKHHSYYYYYNNSCQLVPGNCHFSNHSYLFCNISHCTAVCSSNVTRGDDKHSDGINLLVLILSCAGGVLFIIFVAIVTIIIIIRRRSHNKARRYYEQVLAMINDDDDDDYDDDDDDDTDNVTDDDVIK